MKTLLILLRTADMKKMAARSKQAKRERCTLPQQPRWEFTSLPIPKACNIVHSTPHTCTHACHAVCLSDSVTQKVVRMSIIPRATALDRNKSLLQKPNSYSNKFPSPKVLVGARARNQAAPFAPPSNCRSFGTAVRVHRTRTHSTKTCQKCK